MTPTYSEKYHYQRLLFFKRKVKEVFRAWKETDRKIEEFNAGILKLKKEFPDDGALIEEATALFTKRMKRVLR